MLSVVLTMRRGATGAAAAVLLSLAVLLMHTGIVSAAPVGGHAGMRMPMAAPHAPEASADHDAHHVKAQKPTVEGVHGHHAHMCAGVVVHHQALAAPSLVAVLSVGDRVVAASPLGSASAARGPPPWTVLDLSELCVLRV